MTYRALMDYAASIVARNHRKLIVFTGFALAIGATCELCRENGKHTQTFETAGSQPDITIDGPLGTYKIYGAKEWLEPVVRQGRMMNKIEALENHNQFPHLSGNPEDYLKE